MAKALRKVAGPEVPFPPLLKLKLRSGGTVNRRLGVGQYRAYQIGDLVTVAATGMAPNLTTQVSLVQFPTFVFPPEFGLFFVDGEISLPALKPFHVEAHFYSKNNLKSVGVTDAKGLHRVTVTQF